MRFSTVAAALLLPVGAAFAATHVVQVGGTAGLVYTPNQLTGVADGDVVQFQFLDKNHTVTQSTFAAPCSNITDASGAVTGVDSGFQAVNATSGEVPVWQITINNASTPLWFYCRQAKHCQAGMVFAVNPTAAKTFDAFKTTAAASTSVNGSPATGSTVNTTSSTGSTGSSSASGSTSASTAAISGGAVSSASASSPSAAATDAAGNGAGALHVPAALLSLAAVAAGLLL